MPRFRFTVRWLIVVVAIAAVALGAYELRQRSLAFQEMARFHGMLERGTNVQPNPPPKDLEAYRKAWVEYQRGMRLKYERASHYPWLPLAPDPPLPK